MGWQLFYPGELVILSLPCSHQLFWLVTMLSRASDSQGMWPSKGRWLRNTFPWRDGQYRLCAEPRMEESELNIYTVALLTLHDFRPVRRKARLNLCPVPDCILWQFTSCISCDASHNCSGDRHMWGPSDGTADLLRPQLTVLLRSSLPPWAPFSASIHLLPIPRLHDRKTHRVLNIFLQSA